MWIELIQRSKKQNQRGNLKRFPPSVGADTLPAFSFPSGCGTPLPWCWDLWLPWHFHPLLSVTCPILWILYTWEADLEEVGKLSDRVLALALVQSLALPT
jgi:hypothetical protein